MMKKPENTTQLEFKVAHEIICGDLGYSILTHSDDDSEATIAITDAMFQCIGEQLQEMLDGDRSAQDDFLCLRENIKSNMMEQRRIVVEAQTKFAQMQAGQSALSLLLLDVMQQKGMKVFETESGTFEVKTDFTSDQYRIVDPEAVASKYSKTKCEVVFDDVLLKLDLEAGVEIEGVEKVERTNVLHVH